MKITAIAVTSLLAGIAASTGEAGQAEGMKVTVCTGTGVNNDFTLVESSAKTLATRIFADAGVHIDWRWSRHCPMHAIRISFSTSTPRNRLPGALAYSKPFEGVHIEIFYDRVRQNSIYPYRVLAHVLVHEITHILQGTAVHSEIGIMKARWTPEDFANMRVKSLPFTPADLELIHLGLAAREQSSFLMQTLQVTDHANR
jgi:hypothetical protein